MHAHQRHHSSSSSSSSPLREEQQLGAPGRMVPVGVQRTWRRAAIGVSRHGRNLGLWRCYRTRPRRCRSLEYSVASRQCSVRGHHHHRRVAATSCARHCARAEEEHAAGARVERRSAVVRASRVGAGRSSACLIAVGNIDTLFHTVYLLRWFVSREPKSAGCNHKVGQCVTWHAFCL